MLRILSKALSRHLEKYSELGYYRSPERCIQSMHTDSGEKKDLLQKLTPQLDKHLLLPDTYVPELVENMKKEVDKNLQICASQKYKEKIDLNDKIDQKVEIVEEVRQIQPCPVQVQSCPAQVQKVEHPKKNIKKSKINKTEKCSVQLNRVIDSLEKRNKFTNKSKLKTLEEKQRCRQFKKNSEFLTLKSDIKKEIKDILKCDKKKKEIKVLNIKKPIKSSVYSLEPCFKLEVNDKIMNMSETKKDQYFQSYNLKSVLKDDIKIQNCFKDTKRSKSCDKVTSSVEILEKMVKKQTDKLSDKLYLLGLKLEKDIKGMLASLSKATKGRKNNEKETKLHHESLSNLKHQNNVPGTPIDVFLKSQKDKIAKNPPRCKTIITEDEWNHTILPKTQQSTDYPDSFEKWLEMGNSYKLEWLKKHEKAQRASKKKLNKNEILKQPVAQTKETFKPSHIEPKKQIITCQFCIENPSNKYDILKKYIKSTPEQNDIKKVKKSSNETQHSDKNEVKNESEIVKNEVKKPEIISQLMVLNNNHLDKLKAPVNVKKEPEVIKKQPEIVKNEPEIVKNEVKKSEKNSNSIDKLIDLWEKPDNKSLNNNSDFWTKLDNTVKRIEEKKNVKTFLDHDRKTNTQIEPIKDENLCEKKLDTNFVEKHPEVNKKPEIPNEKECMNDPKHLPINIKDKAEFINTKKFPLNIEKKSKLIKNTKDSQLNIEKRPKFVNVTKYSPLDIKKMPKLINDAKKSPLNIDNRSKLINDNKDLPLNIDNKLIKHSPLNIDNRSKFINDTKDSPLNIDNRSKFINDTKDSPLNIDNRSKFINDTKDSPINIDNRSKFINDTKDSPLNIDNRSNFINHTENSPLNIDNRSKFINDTKDSPINIDNRSKFINDTKELSSYKQNVPNIKSSGDDGLKYLTENEQNISQNEKMINQYLEAYDSEPEMSQKQPQKCKKSIYFDAHDSEHDIQSKNHDSKHVNHESNHVRNVQKKDYLNAHDSEHDDHGSKNVKIRGELDNYDSKQVVSDKLEDNSKHVDGYDKLDNHDLKHVDACDKLVNHDLKHVDTCGKLVNHDLKNSQIRGELDNYDSKNIDSYVDCDKLVKTIVNPKDENKPMVEKTLSNNEQVKYKRFVKKISVLVEKNKKMKSQKILNKNVCKSCAKDLETERLLKLLKRVQIATQKAKKNGMKNHNRFLSTCQNEKTTNDDKTEILEMYRVISEKSASLAHNLQCKITKALKDEKKE